MQPRRRSVSPSSSRRSRLSCSFEHRLSMNRNQTAEANSTNSLEEWAHFVTPWEQRLVFAIVFSLVTFFGVCTNGVVLFLSLCTDLRNHIVNLFIANLAVSDFMSSAVFVLGQNFYILYRETMPTAGCSWLAFFNVTAAMQEFVFPPFLAINRYVSLYHNQYYNKIYTAKNMMLMAAASWTYSITITSIFTLNGHVGYDRLNEHCCVIAENNRTWTIIYWMTIIGPLIFVFDTTMIFCNWKIYKKLSGHLNTNEIALRKSVLNENREILYLMIIDMLIPICTHSVYNVLKFALPTRVPLATRLIFTILFLSSAGLRGFVIVKTLRPYRNAFRRYFLCRSINKIASITATAAPASVTNAKPNDD